MYSLLTSLACIRKELTKGPFKYYIIKEVGEWGGQMMMFDDKMGGWGWLNDDVIKKYTYKEKKTLFACAEKKVGIVFKKKPFFYAVTFL